VLGHAYRNLRDVALDFFHFLLFLTHRLSIARVLAVERVRRLLIASQHKKIISRSHTNRGPHVQG
jgi:hypothetical protein